MGSPLLHCPRNSDSLELAVGGAQNSNRGGLQTERGKPSSAEGEELSTEEVPE